MAYVAWIVLILIGLGASVAVFLWALRTGQFSEQDRARFLPLRDEFPMPRVEDPARLTAEVYALLAAVGLGIAAMGGALVLTILGMRG